MNDLLIQKKESVVMSARDLFDNATRLKFSMVEINLEGYIKMSNLKKAFLVVGAILLVIGFILIIEGQILGDRTIPAAVASTVVGIACILAAIGAKAKKS